MRSHYFLSSDCDLSAFPISFPRTFFHCRPQSTQCERKCERVSANAQYHAITMQQRIRDEMRHGKKKGPRTKTIHLFAGSREPTQNQSQTERARGERMILHTYHTSILSLFFYFFFEHPSPAAAWKEAFNSRFSVDYWPIFGSFVRTLLDMFFSLLHCSRRRTENVMPKIQRWMAVRWYCIAMRM